MSTESRVIQTSPVKTRFPVNIWWRFLTPSMSDLFFLIVLTVLFLASSEGWSHLLLDADTALHIRIGQHILATGSVPGQDLFAFSKPGETWYAFEWLSEVIFGFLYNLAGLKGVVLLAGGLIAGYVTLLFRYSIWSGANGLIAMALVLSGANGTSIHFHARPHLFTLLLLAISIWLMEDYRRNGGRRIWMLAPLTVLWVNLHGGFAIFFVLLALRVAGCLVEALVWPARREIRRQEAIRLAAVGAVCAAASLLNPYHIHLHAHIFETLRSSWITTHVHEFKSPIFRGEAMLQVMLLLFAGLALLVPLVQKKRIVEPLWIAFLAFCALVSVRHATIFLLVAVPVIARELSAFWAAAVSEKSPTSLPRILDDLGYKLKLASQRTSLFIPAVLVVLAVAPLRNWPAAFPDVNVPVKLIERHSERIAASRVFTSDQNADYLIFRNYPAQRVFIDSRHNYYGEKIGNEYLAISSGGPKWRELLDRYGFDAVLCPSNAALASLLKLTGHWRVVEDDGRNVLFERGGQG